MATRSFIGKVQEDGTIQALYCHYDGYPENTGIMLVKHYNNPEQVDELLSKSDLRGIYGPIQDVEELSDGEAAKEFDSIGGYTHYARDSWAEYTYLYQNGSWSCLDYDDTPIDLYRLLEEMEEKEKLSRTLVDGGRI